MPYFVSKPAPGSPHRMAVKLDEVFADAPTGARAGVMLLLDLGAVDPALAGTKVPFVEMAVWMEGLRLTLDASGKWTHDDGGGGGAVARLSAALDKDIEENSMVESVASANVELVESEDTYDSDVVWCSDFEAVQSLEPDWAGPGFVYAGRVESAAYFGCVHAAFHPQDRVLELYFECT